MSEDKQSLLERITVDPDILVGKPIIRGLRISVEQVIKALAAGISQHELLEEHPELEQEDIQAALLYAAERVGEEKVFMVREGNSRLLNLNLNL